MSNAADDILSSLTGPSRRLAKTAMKLRRRSQGELRDEITSAVLGWINERDGNPGHLIEAAVACMGAAAICLGCLSPSARERAADSLAMSLLDHANKRAEEIRSGAFDSNRSQ